MKEPKKWTKKDADRLQKLTREMIAEHGESFMRKMAFAAEMEALEAQCIEWLIERLQGADVLTVPVSMVPFDALWIRRRIVGRLHRVEGRCVKVDRFTVAGKRWLRCWNHTGEDETG